MAGSALSRRLSEFIGVGAVRAGADLADCARQLQRVGPGVVLQHRLRSSRRRILPDASARSLAELSFQLLGYAAYLIPIVLVVIGWHYFWCRVLDAAYTKLFGAGLLFACVCGLPVARLRQPGGRPARTSAPAATSANGWPALLAEYLNRTGSIILILTLLFLAIILSTQFSFGRFFAFVGQLAARPLGRRARRHARAARGARAREAAPGRPQEASRQGAGKEPRRSRSRRGRRPTRSSRSGAEPTREATRSRQRSRRAPPRWSGRPRPRSRRPRRSPTPPPAIRRPAPTPAAPTLPLPEPEKAAGRAQEGRLHAAAAGAARRAARRAQDRRARADGRRAAARREVPRVLGRRLGRPDPPGPGRHDLRVQAGRRREVQQDHRPCRRSVPGDAGRVGAHRPHSRASPRSASRFRTRTAS